MARAPAPEAAAQPLAAQEQALGMLCCAVDRAREGGHQYLSGTLHNMAKALAHAQPQADMQAALLAAGYGSSERLLTVSATACCTSHMGLAPRQTCRAPCLLLATFQARPPDRFRNGLLRLLFERAPQADVQGVLFAAACGYIVLVRHLFV